MRAWKILSLADKNDWWSYTIDLKYLRPLLLELQDWKCAICDKPLLLTDSTIDHVYPKSRRLGNQHRDNVLVAHHDCNQHKADSEPAAGEVKLLLKVNATISKMRMLRRCASS